MSESRIYKTGPHWHGFREVTRLIVFGDSYSDIGWNHTKNRDSKNPLGMGFPGLTWNEPGQPNWIGHLITKYCPHPRFEPTKEHQSGEYRDYPLLVYDYARGGDTIAGVRLQIQNSFLPIIGQKPEWAMWNADNSLFITWVGINDCAFTTDPSSNINKLFELQEELYEGGARNFLFIDVPPIYRSPAVPPNWCDRSKTSTDNWNQLLESGVESFAAAHGDITAAVFSSARTFHKLLDDPPLYGFSVEDGKKNGGAIWVDHIHPTSRVHDFIANDLAEFLRTAVTGPMA